MGGKRPRRRRYLLLYFILTLTAISNIITVTLLLKKLNSTFGITTCYCLFLLLSYEY